MLVKEEKLYQSPLYDIGQFMFWLIFRLPMLFSASYSIVSSFLPQFTPVSLFAHETDSTSQTRSSGFRLFFNVNVQTCLAKRDHLATRLTLCIIIFISMVKHLEEYENNRPAWPTF